MSRSPESETPESAFDRLGMEQPSGDNNPMPQLENGYFMKKFSSGESDDGGQDRGGAWPVADDSR